MSKLYRPLSSPRDAILLRRLYGHDAVIEDLAGSDADRVLGIDYKIDGVPIAFRRLHNHGTRHGHSITLKLRHGDHPEVNDFDKLPNVLFYVFAFDRHMNHRVDSTWLILAVPAFLESPLFPLLREVIPPKLHKTHGHEFVTLPVNHLVAYPELVVRRDENPIEFASYSKFVNHRIRLFDIQVLAANGVDVSPWVREDEDPDFEIIDVEPIEPARELVKKHCRCGYRWLQPAESVTCDYCGRTLEERKK